MFFSIAVAFVGASASVPNMTRLTNLETLLKSRRVQNASAESAGLGLELTGSTATDFLAQDPKATVGVDGLENVDMDNFTGNSSGLGGLELLEIPAGQLSDEQAHGQMKALQLEARTRILDINQKARTQREKDATELAMVKEVLQAKHEPMEAKLKQEAQLIEEQVEDHRQHLRLEMRNAENAARENERLAKLDEEAKENHIKLATKMVTQQLEGRAQQIELERQRLQQQIDDAAAKAALERENIQKHQQQVGALVKAELLESIERTKAHMATRLAASNTVTDNSTNAADAAYAGEDRIPESMKASDVKSTVDDDVTKDATLVEMKRREAQLREFLPPSHPSNLLAESTPINSLPATVIAGACGGMLVLLIQFILRRPRVEQPPLLG